MSLQLRVSKAAHRGDPGLGSFFKKVGRGIAGAATGLVTGGIPGAVVGGVAGLAGGSARQRQTRALVGGAAAGTGSALIRSARQFAPVNTGTNGGFRLPFPGPGGIRVDPGAALPGGDPLFMRSLDAPKEGTKLACPSGYHPNKSSYFLQDGTFVPEGSKCVKNRRRNPMNPRALDRAIGRMNSAKRVQAKLRQFSTDKYTAAGAKKDC